MSFTDDVTYIFIIEQDEDLNLFFSEDGIALKNQPYIFAIQEVNSNSFGLYEVQLYSKVIVPISTVTARNSITSYINQNVMQR